MQAAHPRAPGAVPTEKSASFVRNATYLASLGHQEATRALQQLFLHTHTPVLDFTPGPQILRFLMPCVYSREL